MKSILAIIPILLFSTKLLIGQDTYFYGFSKADVFEDSDSDGQFEHVGLLDEWHGYFKLNKDWSELYLLASEDPLKPGFMTFQVSDHNYGETHTATLFAPAQGYSKIEFDLDNDKITVYSKVKGKDTKLVYFISYSEIK